VLRGCLKKKDGPLYNDQNYSYKKKIYTVRFISVCNNLLKKKAVLGHAGIARWENIQRELLSVDHQRIFIFVCKT